MGDKTDQAKGRVKEAVGTLTGDDDLKREGRDDRLAGEVKEKIDDVVDKAREKLGDVKDKVDEVIDKTKDTVRGK